MSLALEAAAAPPLRPQKQRHAKTSVILTAVTATLALAFTPALAHAVPAQIAQAETSTEGSLLWKVKDSWHDYIKSGPHTITPAPAVDGRTQFEPVTGNIDIATEEVSVASGGSVRYEKWFGPTTGPSTIDVELSNIRVDFAAGSGTVTVDAAGNPDSVPNGAQNDIELVDITAAEFGTSPAGDTTVTLEGNFIEGSGEKIIGFVLYEGQPMSPLTITLPAVETEEVTATALSLTATPSQGAMTGENVSFVASVTPEAAGTVVFSLGSIELGEQPVSNGTATLETNSLPVGTHTINAAFVPADSALFTTSEATLPGYTVSAVEQPSAETTLTLTKPTSPVLPGQTVALAATVTPETSTGTVEFFSTSEVTKRQSSLGESPVVGGTATLSTTTLPIGGNSITARFTPTTTEVGGSTATAQRVGVVDLSSDSIPTPGPDALPISGAEASWNFSSYAFTRNFPWKALVAPATVEAGVWKLTEGIGESDGNVARIQFPGTIENNTWGYASSFSNPELTLTRAGTGFWTAEVASYCTVSPSQQFCAITEPEDMPKPKRVVLSTFKSVTDLTGPGSANDISVNFDWSGSTAAGTWAAGQNAGFHNQFLWAIHAAERGYFHASGTAADLDKPVAPLEVTFDWAAKTKTELEIELDDAGIHALGDDIKLTATVTPAVAGTVRVFATNEVDGTETLITTAAVQNGSALVTLQNLVAGGHSVRAEFLPADETTALGSSTLLAAHIGIVDKTQPAPAVLDNGARTIQNASARWEWMEYSTWNEKWVESAVAPARVEDQFYVLNNGAGLADADTAQINFPGTIRMSSYPGWVNGNFGSWLEASALNLTVNRDGTGHLTGTVRASETESWDENADPGTKVTIATVSSVKNLPAAGTHGEAQINFDFVGSVASGTWAAGNDDAWHNSFVSLLPDGIRPFYFNSGLNVDSRKDPLPMSVSFTWPSSGIQQPGTPTPSEADLTDSNLGSVRTPGTAESGTPFSVYVGTGLAGTAVDVYLFSTPVHLGTHIVAADGTVQVTLPAGVTPETHRIAVYDASGALIGWDEIEVEQKLSDEEHTTSPQRLDQTGNDVRFAPFITVTILLVLVGAGAMLLTARKRAAQA